MQQTTRKFEREQVSFKILIRWQESTGTVRSAPYTARDISAAGAGLAGSVRIPVGQDVQLETGRQGIPKGAVVRYCLETRQEILVGLEFNEAARLAAQGEEEPDYYEILQLSPNAEMETINRVYRIMAGRFHPDNAETGDIDKFLLLSQAFGVLGDPEKRAAYDTQRTGHSHRAVPLFQAKEFLDDKVGEANRRLGVLCLLYAQRRRNPDHPSLSLLELEEMMAYPREYLQFTLWYLKQKEFIDRDQGSHFTLTALGVDFVEEHTPSNPGLHKLLTQARRGA
jgi:curved DNA-binding protein